MFVKVPFKSISLTKCHFLTPLILHFVIFFSSRHSLMSFTKKWLLIHINSYQWIEKRSKIAVWLYVIIHFCTQFKIHSNWWHYSLLDVFLLLLTVKYTAQKMKFSIKSFFVKCYQIRSFLQIWSHLLKKSLMENFIFCAVIIIPS